MEMKVIKVILRVLTVILLLTNSIESKAQKIALLDTRFKTPIVYTDSVTVGQAASGLIAIPIKGMDTLYSNLTYLTEILDKPQRSKMQSFQLLSNGALIEVSRIPMAYADRYVITLASKINNVGSIMTLSDGKLSNKQVAAKIRKLLSYITTNNSLFEAPKSIHPKIYNVVVISDR